MAKKSYNMYEAKTKLSEIIKEVKKGKEITLMNRGEPVAKVIPFISEPNVRKLGFAKDIKILKGFNDLLDDFEDYL